MVPLLEHSGLENIVEWDAVLKHNRLPHLWAQLLPTPTLIGFIISGYTSGLYPNTALYQALLTLTRIHSDLLCLSENFILDERHNLALLPSPGLFGSLQMIFEQLATSEMFTPEVRQRVFGNFGDTISGWIRTVVSRMHLHAASSIWMSHIQQLMSNLSLLSLCFVTEWNLVKKNQHVGYQCIMYLITLRNYASNIRPIQHGGSYSNRTSQHFFEQKTKNRWCPDSWQSLYA